MEIPEVLKETEPLELKTMLPESAELKIDDSKPTLVYNHYNLDPKWHEGESANRILLLEPSIFERYPISEKALDFVLALSKNIEEIQVFVGEFHELKEQIGNSPVFFKEHPHNTNYEGTEEPRDWMFSVTGYHHSFFAFWKKCQKEMKSW
jgi:deoxyribodipyrimidine photo-lyase